MSSQFLCINILDLVDWESNPIALMHLIPALIYDPVTWASTDADRFSFIFLLHVHYDGPNVHVAIHSICTYDMGLLGTL